MRLSNSPQESTVLRLEQRKSFSCAVEFRDGSGARVDLRGAVLTLDWVTNLAKLDRPETLDSDDVRSVHGVVADTVRGYARFDVQAADLALPAGAYPYTLTLRVAGFSVVVLKGTLELQSNPEFAAVDDTYTVGAPNLTLQVQMHGSAVVAVEVGSIVPPGAQYLSDEDKAKLDLLVITEAGVVVDLTGYATLTQLTDAIDSVTAEIVETQGELSAVSGELVETQTALTALTSEVTDVQGDVAVHLARLNTADARVAAGFTVLTGELKIWAGASAPTGWLLCQGQILLRADYPALFAVIGTAFAGTASLTSAQFRLPQMLDRVPVGAGLAYVLGAYGGAPTHTLSIPEMPQHTHVQNAHAHLTGISPNQAYGAGPFGTATAAVSHAPVMSATSAETATNIAAGGGVAHNNMQPYTVVHYIIKT